MVSDVGNRGVVCATDEISAQIEDLQFTLGEGPCVEAAKTRAPVLVEDLTEQTGPGMRRWPAFTPGATLAGARAVFAFPLRIGTINVGVLNLYRAEPGALSPDQLTGALLAADAAALALLDLDTTSDGAFADDGNVRANYQMQVHQATGMVSVQLGVSVGDAFLMLRARAFSDGSSVSQVARDVVERRLRFMTEDR
jgi:hypothetical protein